MRPAKTCCPTSATTRRRWRSGREPAGGDAARAGDAHPTSRAFVGRSVRDTLAATVAAAAQASPLQLHQALLHAAALHLLRFDERIELRIDNPVAENVDWLDFSHALTFGHAVRLQCTRQPALWPAGPAADGALRSAATRPTSPPTTRRCRRCAAGPWRMRRPSTRECRARVLDHGLAQYIFPVHLLKTWAAVRDEIALGVADDTAQALRAAVNRLLFGARFKQRHLLRTARQAAGFVARED